MGGGQDWAAELTESFGGPELPPQHYEPPPPEVRYYIKGVEVTADEFFWCTDWKLVKFIDTGKLPAAEWPE